MLFNEFETLISALPTSAERRRAISSIIFDSAIGIVDGIAGTDCNKSYWERDYGLYDAVVALYDTLAGRDLVASVKIRDVTFAVNTRIDNQLDLYGLLASNGNASFQGPSFVCGATTIQFAGGVVKFDSGLSTRDSSGYQMVNYSFAGGSIGTGSNFIAMLIDDKHLTLQVPENLTYFDGLTEGGSLKYKILDRTPFCVGPQGRLSLNDLEYDLPGHRPGVSIRADTESCAGDIQWETRSDLADERTSVRSFYRNELFNTLGNVAQDIMQDTRIVPTDSKWDFRIDGMAVAYIFGDGSMGCDGDFVGGGSAAFIGAMTAASLETTGDVECDGLIVNAGAAVLGNVTITGLFSSTLAISSGDEIYAIEGSNKAGVNVDNDEAGLALIVGSVSSGITAKAEFDGSMAFGSQYNSFVFYNAVNGTVTGASRLNILSNSPGDASSIIFRNGNYSGPEMTRIFSDVRGVLCTTDQDTAMVGVLPTGAVRAKGVLTTAIDTTNQVTLNAHCLGQSQEIDGATVIVKDSGTGSFSWFVFDESTSDWEPVI